jgi:TusA-related sulfurtransferase
MAIENQNKKPLFADLTREICPMTFVKAKMLLDRVAPGDLVELALKEGEQLRNVSMSVKTEGHRIENVQRNGELMHVFIRKCA